MKFSFLMSNSISLMEGIWNFEKILSSETFTSSFSPCYSGRISEPSLPIAFFPAFSSALSIFSAGSMFSSSLNRISQFFWMKEQNLFLIWFSGLPRRCLLISDHLLPMLLQSSNIFLSSYSHHSSFLILGSNLLMNLSRICFPFLEPSISDSSFQFLPYFLINFLTVSSSSDDQIL